LGGPVKSKSCQRDIPTASPSIRAVVLCLGLAMLLGGCRDAARTGEIDAGAAGHREPSGMARIIVTFRAPPVSLDAAFLAALTREAGGGLRYVRALAGGQHLFEVDGREAERVMRRLEKRPDVLEVELDRKFRHQR
jgi:hypothetical protein